MADDGDVTISNSILTSSFTFTGSASEGNVMLASLHAADAPPALRQELADMADSGKLRVEVAEVFPLDKAADAFRSNMDGHTRGKIVVAVNQHS